jgi:integrase
MLTDLSIKKLATSDKRREVPDGKISGLYLVLQPSGTKSWALRYRAGGVPRKLTIGPYPNIDLAAARRLAQRAAAEAAEGNDPAAEKKASRAAAQAALEVDTDRVERVVELFVERYAMPKNRDWRETQRILEREVVSRWKGRRLSSITRAHVHEMLDEIVDRAPIRANRALAHFRRMVRWAIERGIVERSPVEGVKAPAVETSRDRVLNDGEIRLIWQAFEAIGWPFGAIGKLLVLTGARLGEVAGLEWREVDLDARTWTIPTARAKNKREHLVPLSDAAVEILANLPRVEGRFGFSTTGRTPVSGFSKAKSQIDALVLKRMRQDAEIRGGDPATVAPQPWRLHDIRRTVATNLQRLGVRLEVTEAVLNHVSGSRAGIVGVYQRHAWADEKRAALDTWARRLDVIVRGAESNVVPLIKGRA